MTFFFQNMTNIRKTEPYCQCLFETLMNVRKTELCHCFFFSDTDCIIISFRHRMCHVSFRHCVIDSLRHWLCHCFFKTLSMSFYFSNTDFVTVFFQTLIVSWCLSLVSDTDCVIVTFRHWRVSGELSLLLATGQHVHQYARQLQVPCGALSWGLCQNHCRWATEQVRVLLCKADLLLVVIKSMVAVLLSCL